MALVVKNEYKVLYSRIFRDYLHSTPGTVFQSRIERPIGKKDIKKVRMNAKIVLSNISYGYNRSKLILDNLTLTINKNQKIVNLEGSELKICGACMRTA